jgi:hypothetical protein
MNRLRLAIHATTRLHPQILWCALLELMRLEIPLLLAIPRRPGGADTGGSHDAPPADMQPLLGQIRRDQGNHLIAQLG